MYVQVGQSNGVSVAAAVVCCVLCVVCCVLCVVCLFVSMCTHMHVSVHTCMCVYVGLQELSNFLAIMKL